MIKNDYFLLRLLLLPLFLLCHISAFSHLAQAEDADTLVPVEATYRIENVLIEGNTLFSEAELAPIIAPYEGRALSASDIQNLRDALTLFYVSQGYLNSGVVVPNQDLSDGVLILQVIEGRLLDLRIDGNKGLRDSYIQKRLLPELDDEAAPILNVEQLQQRLRLLEQDSRIERLHADLKPGLRPGEAELAVTVEEARPYYLNILLDNYISPNVGDWQGTLDFGHQNLSGIGDHLNLNLRRAEGWESYRLEYQRPLNAHNTTFSIWAGSSDSKVVVSEFDALDITSESENYGMELRHPFYRTLATEFAMALSFEQRQSGSFLLGDLFDFIDSGKDGEARVNVLGLSQELIHRQVNQVWVAQSRFDFGLDILDATRGEEPDAVFNAWLGQVQWLRRLGTSGHELFWRFLVRLTDDPMLSSEQFALGGISTVRGYRENQLTRDQGWASSLEWRIDLGRITLPGLDSDIGRFRIVPFIDYGEATERGADTPPPPDLSSIGIGLLWSANDNWSAQLYWAEALRHVEPNPSYSLQEDGLHFQMRLRY